MNTVFSFFRSVSSGLLGAFCLVIVLILVSPRVAAQNTPLCFQLFFPVLQADQGDTVCLPLRVRDFQQIATMQFEVWWDSSKIELVKLDLSGSDVPVIGTGDFNPDLGDHIRMAWFDVQAMGVTLPDSSVLFTLCFRVKTDEPGFYPVSIGEGPPGFSYEVIMFTLPDWGTVPMPLAQQIGGISTAPVAASDVYVSSSCVSRALCGAPVGSASVEAAGGVPPYQYFWTGPNGFSATTAGIDSLRGGIYTVTVTDQNGSTVSMVIEVQATHPGIYSWPYVTEPSLCGQPNGCASVQISGGHPPLSVQWSSGSATVNACGLAPGMYTVVVTDSLGCQDSDSLEIWSDSTVLLAVSSQQIIECNGTGFASVLVEKGTPPFWYQWSTADTTDSIDNLLKGIYFVTVTTAGGCTAEEIAIINDYSVSNWNLQLQKACADTSGTPQGNVYLRFNPNGGIGFPAIVSWSDGTTRLIPEKPANNYLDTLAGVPSGHYAATVTDADGCMVSVQTVLNCTAPPPVPDSITAFYILDEYLNPQYAVDSCAGVYARYFKDVVSLQFTLAWDSTIMEYKQLKIANSALPALTMSDFNPGANEGLKFSWSDPNALGISLPENSLLFEVCFTPKYSFSNVNLTFSEGRCSGAAAGDMPFLGKNGYVLFGLYFPLSPSICKYAALPPSCPSDGYGRILLDGCDVGDPVFGSYRYNGISYSDLSGLLFADSGSYFISAYQNAQSTNSFYAYIPGGADPSPCVWPGDADDNNAVNHHDLLYIGLAYGAAGPQRSAAGLEWMGQECADWTQITATRQINYKNIDTNGDGTVNAADTLAIVQNWSRVVNPARDNPFHAPLGNPTGNPDPPFTLQTDTLAPGQMAALPLLLGSADTPVDSIYGLAFSISYDPSKVQPNLSFQPSGSWLGDPAQLLWLQRNFPGQGRLDVAITRTDGVPVSGWGYIGDVFVIIEDDIFFSPGSEDNAETDFSTDTITKTTLFFSGLHPVNSAAAPGMLDAPPVELVITKTTDAVPEPPAWDRLLAVSPNPASASLFITNAAAPIRRVEIMSLSGVVWVIHEDEGSHSLELPVQRLASGNYFVRIFTEHGVSVRKLSIVR